MKLKTTSLIILLLVSAFTGCSSVYRSRVTKVAAPEQQAAEMPEPVKPYVTDNYVPPKPVEHKLSSGVTLLFLKNPELPKVYGGLYFRGGSLWDQDSEIGSSSFMGSMLRIGGTRKMTPQELDYYLESRSANISSAFGGEFGSVNFDCLKADFNDVFKTFTEVLFTPRYDLDKFNFSKLVSIDSISRRKDDPVTMASLTFGQMLYRGTVSGRVSTSEIIRKLTIEDLKSAYYRYMRPSAAYLAVSGDIELEEVIEIAEKLLPLESFRQANPFMDSTDPKYYRTDKYPPYKFNPQKGIVFIEAPSFTQSTIIGGQLGFPRLTSDEQTITVYNQIFGEGQSSELSMKVRNQLGLAYMAEGMVITGLGKGKNLFTVQTKAESTGRVIAESLKVINESQSKEPPVELLEAKKQALINSFIFSNESPQQILSRVVGYKIARYPEDYDQQLISKLSKVQPADVMQVARQSWNNADWTIVIVGSNKAYQSLIEAKNEFPSYLKNVKIIRGKFDEKFINP